MIKNQSINLFIIRAPQYSLENLLNFKRMKPLETLGSKGSQQFTIIINLTCSFCIANCCVAAFTKKKQKYFKSAKRKANEAAVVTVQLNKKIYICIKVLYIYIFKVCPGLSLLFVLFYFHFEQFFH